MKFNKWTYGLVAVGAVSLASAARADEAKLTALQTALSATTISGYVDVSAQYNIGGQNNAYANGTGFATPPYAYGAGKADGFNLNSVLIAIDRPLDETPWAAGYHVDFQLGADAVLGDGIRQAYVLLRTPIGNGIDWKVGLFDTIIGYESSSSPLNPNVTRSYGYTIEPTSHAGVVATYKVCSWLTAQAGVANTSNVGGQGVGYTPGWRTTYETQKTYLGKLSFTAPESWGWAKGGVLDLGVVHSLDGSSAPSTWSPWQKGVNTRDNYYAGLTIPTPIKALKFGASFDYYRVGNAEAVVNPSDDYSYAIGLYSTYQATDKLSFSVRGEYFNDGAANVYSGNIFPTWDSQAAVEEVTFTVQYNLWANVLSRLEFRWDHAESGTPYGSNKNTDFYAGDANRGNSFALIANFIYQF